VTGRLLGWPTAGQRLIWAPGQPPLLAVAPQPREIDACPWVAC